MIAIRERTLKLKVKGVEKIMENERMKKFIQVVAYETDECLAFEHDIIEAKDIEDAYQVFVDKPKGFRNWYVIPI